MNPLLNAAFGPACAGRNCDGIAASLFISSLLGGTPDPFTVLGALQPRIAAGYAAPWRESVESEGDYASWAAYGDATGSLTDATNLTLGLRYTYDEKRFELFTAYRNEILPGVPIGLAFFHGAVPVIDVSQDESWASWSGRLVLDHHFGAGAMAYASIATGFKSGGFNSLNFAPGLDNSYDAEEVVSYELGLKGAGFDDRLRYSGALFHYVYDNLQTLDLIGQPIPSQNLRNADADGQGVEIELAWLPGANWLLSANYSWLETEFTDFDLIPAAGETPADDLTGEPRAESPEHRFTLGAEYVRPLAHLGELVARLDYTWSDERVSPTRGPVDAYGLLGGRIAWRSIDAHWELALWGSNLTDEEEITLYGNGSVVHSTPGWRIPPRMWGVDLMYRL